MLAYMHTCIHACTCSWGNSAAHLRQGVCCAATSPNTWLSCKFEWRHLHIPKSLQPLHLHMHVVLPVPLTALLLAHAQGVLDRLRSSKIAAGMCALACCTCKLLTASKYRPKLNLCWQSQVAPHLTCLHDCTRKPFTHTHPYTTHTHTHRRKHTLTHTNTSAHTQIHTHTHEHMCTHPHSPAPCP